MPIIQTTPRTVPVGGYQAAATSPVGASPYDHHEHHHDHDHDYDMAAGGSGSGMYAAMQHDGDHSGHDGMDHGGMDHDGHGGMDHGGMNHGGMNHGSDSSSMCAMSMIWNTDPTNVCIVFPWWRITSSRSSLYSSLFLLVLIGVGYEWLRLQLRRLDRKLLASQAAGRRGKRKMGRRGGDVIGSAPSTPRRMQSQQQQQQQHRRVASVSSSSKGLLVSSLQDADDNAGGGSSIRRTATPHLSDASGNESPDPANTPPYLAGRRHPTARKYTAVGGGQAGTTASVPLSAMFSIPNLPTTLTRRQQLIRSFGYATSVCLSFFLMLAAMTMNAYVFGAVVVGAGAGHFLFQRPGAEKTGQDQEDEYDESDEDGLGGEDDAKGMACH